MHLLLKDKIILFFFALLLLIIGINKINSFQDYNPTVIIKDHKFDSKQNKELLKGDKVVGEFIAENNHLGTISIKFNTHNRINSDYLQFRIKESDSNRWYYSKKYKVDQFQNNQYFPFGFPTINGSKDKKYQIEIESLDGIKEKSVQLMTEDSPFLSRYSFPKAYLQQNKKEIPMFIFNKIKSYFNHIDLNIYLSLLIITLLLLYLLRLVNINKLLDRFKKIDKVIIRSNDSFFIKLKKNRLIKKLRKNYLAIFSLLYIGLLWILDTYQIIIIIIIIFFIILSIQLLRKKLF